MFETALLVGGALGVRHAFEADHIAAVATLVEDTDHSSSTGVAWGLGHSIPIIVLGAIFLILDLQLPHYIVIAIEAIVALLLIALGVRVLAGRNAIGLSLLRHIHGSDPYLTHTEHIHVSIRGRKIGFTHSHANEESFAVGIVHGLAGSGGVVIVLAAAAPTSLSGFAFLLGFAVATVATMGLAATGWGHLLGKTTRLHLVAGTASILVGLLLIAQITGLMTVL